MSYRDNHKKLNDLLTKAWKLVCEEAKQSDNPRTEIIHRCLTNANFYMNELDLKYPALVPERIA